MAGDLLACWQRPPAVCQARRAIGGHVPVVETSSAVRKFLAGVGGSGGKGPPVSDRGRGQAPMGLDRGPCSEVSPTAADRGPTVGASRGSQAPGRGGAQSPTGVGDRHQWVGTGVPAQRCHRRQRTWGSRRRSEQGFASPRQGSRHSMSSELLRVGVRRRFARRGVPLVGRSVADRVRTATSRVRSRSSQAPGRGRGTACPASCWVLAPAGGLPGAAGHW